MVTSSLAFSDFRPLAEPERPGHRHFARGGLLVHPADVGAARHGGHAARRCRSPTAYAGSFSQVHWSRFPAATGVRRHPGRVTNRVSNVSYRLDSATASNCRAAAAERIVSIPGRLVTTRSGTKRWPAFGPVTRNSSALVSSVTPTFLTHHCASDPGATGQVTERVASISESAKPQSYLNLNLPPKEAPRFRIPLLK